MIRGFVCLLISIAFYSDPVKAQEWIHAKNRVQENITQKNADSALYWYSRYQKSLPADSIKTTTNINLITGLARFFYDVKSNYSQAAVFYQEASGIIANHYTTESDEFAMNENFLGQVWYFQRDYSKAETHYLNSKRIWEKVWGKQSAKYASSCNSLGVLYNDKGDYLNGEAQHTEARMIREKLFTKENAAYAQSCNNLAVTYWNLGQNDKAEPLAIEAKEIRGRLANVPKSAYAISCVNLANIYRDMGKFLQAEPLYIEARKVREDFFTKEHDYYALSCTILADLYYFMKQYDKAEPLYLEAKEIRLRLAPSRSYFYAQSCSDLAQLYREMNRYKESERLALEADTVFQTMGDAVISEIALNNNSLGALYFFMRQYDKAEALLLKARKTWEKSLGEFHPYYSSNSMSLARLSWARKNFTVANDYYLKAIDAQQHQATRMFSFTSENEKQLYLDNIAANDDEYQSFYYTAMANGNNGQPYAISLAHRNQVLSSSLQLRQQVFASGDTSLNQTYTRWTDTKKRLAFLYARSGTNTADDSTAKEMISQLEKIGGVMEKEIVRKLSNRSSTISEPVKWKSIQSGLKDNEAAIEFIEFKYFDGERSTDSVFYAALILKKDATEPEMVRLFEKRELDTLLISSADGIATINKIYTRGLGLKKNNAVSIRSYEKIWQPLEAKLAGITRVYYAPAGLLHRIAFAALPINATTVLSDKYELVQLSSTALLLNKNSEIIQEKDSIMLFGGIRYTADPNAAKPVITTGKVSKRSGFGYLPGTETEVSGIAMNGRVKKYKPRLFTGQTAKENIIKEMNGQRSPRVLHIATHGFFFDDPQQDAESIKKPSSGGQAFKQSGNPLFRAGLLFAGANDSWNGKYIDGQNEDGILTAYEVSNMYLPNTSLVVLSACETALGDIKGSEGVYGLQRSFKMAGVNYLLMSLWKVPDVETSEFMQLFYKNLFDGKPIDHSFTIAQSAMKTKYRREPFKWAAWILVK